MRCKHCREVIAISGRYWISTSGLLTCTANKYELDKRTVNGNHHPDLDDHRLLERWLEEV